MFSPVIRRLVVPACLVALVMLFGCSDDDNPTGGGGGDPTQSDSILTVANNILGDLMDDMLNQTMPNIDSSFRPHDIDFTPAYDKYSQALAANPANTAAKFGKAMTGMLIILADPSLNQLYEDFKNFYDDSLSKVSLPGGTPQVILKAGRYDPGLPIRPEYLGALTTDPTQLQALSMTAAQSGPAISELQSVLRTQLLPKINDAITALNQIISVDSFQFILTADMQGNPGADPIILDHTDFIVFKGVLHSIRAGLEVFFSRDIDLASYDIDGIELALQRNSEFGSLVDDGDVMMAGALADLLAAATAARNAITSLNKEIATGSSQLGDFLTVGHPDDTLILNDISDAIDEYRSYFTGPHTLQVIWTVDTYCMLNPQTQIYECFDITDTLDMVVNVASLFTQPWENPKQMLPDYTITFDELPGYQEIAAQSFSETRFWNLLSAIYGTTDHSKLIDSVNTYYWAGYSPLPPAGTEAYYDYLSEWPMAGLYVMGWEDVVLQDWCTFGSKELYCYFSEIHMKYVNARYNNTILDVCAYWTATSYSTWLWPDPTFNGLFPDMTQTDLKELIFSDPGQWQRGGCDTLYLGF